MTWQSTLTNSLILGVGAFATTTLALMAVAGAERKALAQPVNAVSHIVYGARTYSMQSAASKYFVVGMFLNLAALIGWAVVAELALQSFKAVPAELALNAGVAIGTTIVAWIVDFHVVPVRFTPGFEHVLSRGGLMSIYFVLAGTLFVGSLYRTLV